MIALLTSLGFAAFNKVILGLGEYGGKKVLRRIADSPASAGEARARLLALADGAPPQDSDRELIEKILRDDATLQQSLAVLIAQLAEDRAEFKSKLDEILDAILHPKTLATSEPLPTLERDLRGRAADCDRLQKWLWSGTPRILQIAAPSGYGKTALLQAVLVPSTISYIRRELRKGATAHSVAGDLYECLSNKPARPKFDERLSDLLATLHGRKDLLIIENLHELLDGNEPKDSEAATLLTELGKSGCRLLVTGWPVSQAFGGDNAIIQDWELAPIEADAGIQVLRDQGVIGEPQVITLENVVEQLECNPASLITLGSVLRRIHQGQAAILDIRCDYYVCPYSPLDMMWSYLGLDQQLVLASVCVLRREVNARRIARMLQWPLDRVNRALDVLSLWLCTVHEHGEVHPVHDTRRNMVTRGMGDAMEAIHRRAADLWVEDGKAISSKTRAKNITELQPWIEVGYHLVQIKDGDSIYRLLKSCWGTVSIDELADMFGAWTEMTELWNCVAFYSSNDHWQAIAWKNLGYFNYLCGKWDTALTEHQISIKLAIELKDHALVAMNRYHIAQNYHCQNLFDSALCECKASLKICKNLTNRQGVALCIRLMGVIFCDQGQLDKSLKMYKASLRIFEALGDQRSVAKCHHEIGVIHHLQGQYSEAVIELDKSFKILEELGDWAGQATAQAQIGLAYLIQNKFRQSFLSLIQAFNIFAMLGDPRIEKVQIGLVHLRHNWGAAAFDDAWRKHTGQEVPAELIQATDTPSSE